MSQANTARTFSNVDMKLAVVDAMTVLMKETHVDKLKVGDICAQAGISRSAFYRYFEDKYEVAQWHISYVHSQGTDLIGRTLSWYDGYFYSEAGFARYRDFYLNVSKSNDVNSINRSSPRQRRQTLIETIVDYHHAQLTPKLQFQVYATAAMELEMMPWWNRELIESSMEERCRWMCELVPKELFELLNTPATS